MAIEEGTRGSSGGALQGGPSVAPRHLWMDALRGASILVVILYHASVVGGAGAVPVLDVVNNVVAPLRMPTMVFLSGMLVERSLRKGPRAYVAGKLRNVLHPYLVWSLIMLFGVVVLLRDQPFRPGMLTWIAVAPMDHLWFLWFLLFYYALALLIARVPPLWVAAACFAVSLGLSWLTGENKELTYLAAFFFVGVAAGRSARSWQAVVSSRGLRAAMVVGVPILVVLAASAGEEIRYRAEMLPLVLLGVVAVSEWSRRSRRFAHQPFLRFVGRESLVFYLVHLPLIFVLDAVLLWDVPPLVEVPVLAVTALALSAGIALAARRSRALGFLFRIPAPDLRQSLV